MRGSFTAYSEEFWIDSIRYIFEVSMESGVAFYLCDYNENVNLLNEDEIGWNYGEPDIVISVGATGICRSPNRLFRTVTDIALKWLKRTRAPYFFFKTDNIKKQRIYLHVIERLAHLNSYSHQVICDGDVFWVYIDGLSR
ncbi:hypothetical protein [Magnetospirillum sp. SS-4]|uniref:hypothetical protein n=1 Tax=Magnetospirillum sp. SS-4 TaxID=2681465 RepID=UPI0013841A0C|nr:hypothetical protein [Magnetospirillum sp. SS-4]CAA7618427.1 hypothetical protein MTBSS4_210099 [Magnetospirillum sp. SS-4]